MQLDCVRPVLWIKTSNYICFSTHSQVAAVTQTILHYYGHIGHTVTSSYQVCDHMNIMCSSCDQFCPLQCCSAVVWCNILLLCYHWNGIVQRKSVCGMLVSKAGWYTSISKHTNGIDRYDIHSRVILVSSPDPSCYAREQYGKNQRKYDTSGAIDPHKPSYYYYYSNFTVHKYISKQ